MNIKWMPPVRVRIIKDDDSDSNPDTEDTDYDWLDHLRDCLLPEYGPRCEDDWTFRVAGPKSQGVNEETGIKAGLFKDKEIKDIPNIDSAGALGYPGRFTSAEFEEHIFDHLAGGSVPTPWISTTTSLSRALRILFGNHPEEGRLFVISTQKSTNPNAFRATELQQCFPSSKTTADKSDNEMLFFGKIDPELIVGCVDVRDPQLRAGLKRIARPLFILKRWGRKADWDKMMETEYRDWRYVSPELRDAAIEVSEKFSSQHDEPLVAFLAQSFLGDEFRIFVQEDEDEAILERIRELRRWTRGDAVDDLTRAIKLIHLGS